MSPTDPFPGASTFSMLLIVFVAAIAGLAVLAVLAELAIAAYTGTRPSERLAVAGLVLAVSLATLGAVGLVALMS